MKNAHLVLNTFWATDYLPPSTVPWLVAGCGGWRAEGDVARGALPAQPRRVLQEVAPAAGLAGVLRRQQPEQAPIQHSSIDVPRAFCQNFPSVTKVTGSFRHRSVLPICARAGHLRWAL